MTHWQGPERPANASTTKTGGADLHPASANVDSEGGRTAGGARLQLLLACAAGVSVACNYYNQAMLVPIATAFHASTSDVAAIPAVTQGANAFGILFLGPLGDLVERKTLILTTGVALVFALLAAALAPSLSWLVVASFGIGLFASLTQQVVPFAVAIAAPEARGRALGIVMSGLLIGILLARTVSGIVADALGWPFVFAGAAVSVAILLAVMAIRLPPMPATESASYTSLVRSLWTLLRVHPGLRRCIVVQALMFAGFMGFWSSVPFLLSEAPYHRGASAVGLLALVGVAGALTTPLFGALADRHGAKVVVLSGALLLVATFAGLGLFGHAWPALIVGVLCLDIALQGSQVANQSQIYALDPAAPARLNTLFIAGMLAAGGIGSGLANVAFAWIGWWGPCLFGMACATLASALATRGSALHDGAAQQS